MALRRWCCTVILLAPCLGSLVLAQAPTSVNAIPEKKHLPPPEYGPHLEGVIVALPLVLLDGYPFVDGAINGEAGELLFDLGASNALAVDDHTVGLPGGINTGHGSFGSGQIYDAHSYPLIDELTLVGGLRYKSMRNVPGHAGLPIEQHIIHEFIGWLGVDFFSGYVAKLDYTKPAVTFYRDDASGSGELAALVGERVVKELPISAASGHKNLMNLRVTVGHTQVLATLDTGGHSEIIADEAQLSVLKKAGLLQQESEERGTLSGLVIEGLAVAPMVVEISHASVPYVKWLPPYDGPLMTLGYEFLSRYKTVWDYDDNKLTLLEK